MPLVIAAILACACNAARAETPEQWIELGTRVHGGFGAFIPLGIRIGLDALAQLGAKPREVTVLYFDSEKAPCACVADGIAIATAASVGQRTLEIAQEKAPAGALAIVVIKSKETRQQIRYTVADMWLGKVAELNRTLDPRGRYDAVMDAQGLFQAELMK